MSFWDTDAAKAATSGGKFLSASEKAALIDNAVVLTITGVRKDEKNQYQGQASPRYVVTFLVPNPLTGENEERLYGFGINPEEQSSRDKLLAALKDYLDTDEGAADSINVVLEKSGNFIAIRKAEDA